MRTRDVTIPLALWICAAICAHFLFGSGGLVVAKVHDDRAELWKLSHEASSLAKQSEQTFEVSLGEPTEDEPAAPPPPPPKPPEPPKPPPVASQKPPVTPPPAKPKEAPKPEKRVLVAKKTEEKKTQPLPEDLPKDRRVAVRQHVTPDQKDNPTAKFIADQANHVNEETRATQTSHDRDDDHPSPGAAHHGTDRSPGDSEKTRIADSAEHKGEKNRAPGERGTDVDVQEEPKLPKPQPQPAGTVAAITPQAPSTPHMVNSEPRPASPTAPDTAPQPVPGGATPPSPEVESTSSGAWSFNPARQGGAAGVTPQPNAGVANPNRPGGRLWSLPGLGQPSAPGTLNLNLLPNQIASIVGEDQLRKLREADGERRRSEHRGSWAGSNFDRWKSAIENYVASVKEGNQTALNAAQVPFATYLNGMHERIHPIFAESFLGSLDALPPSDPMNDQHLVTKLEIVLTRDGHLKKMGVVMTSGITRFDIAALDSVERASPFGPAPKAIVSPDGNVYLHWEFHRDAVYACSTMGARPFMLNNPSPSRDPMVPPVPPAGPVKERNSPGASPNDAREGRNDRAPLTGRRRIAQSGPPSLRLR
jgi:outer membrane biosynthesis protein TonB